jgi:murein DD-endopeptidase MepM/ murein hydrolase activator NlpD
VVNGLAHNLSAPSRHDHQPSPSQSHRVRRCAVNAGVTAVVGAGLAVTLAVCGVGAIALADLGTDPGCAAPAGASTDGWDQQQVANAVTIVTVGARLRVAPYGWVIAVATAMQESRLRNLGDLGTRNDHDSLGLFQQRPSQGWGTPTQLRDPVYAAAAFYAKLLRIPGWADLPLTVAAQRVQVSAYPNAYAKWEDDARALVAAVAERLGLPGGCSLSTPVGWVLPLPAGSYRLSSPYGPRWGGFHAGQDFAAATGTPIRAAAAGVVVAAGCTSPFCDRPGIVDATGRPLTAGCGLRVIIQSRDAIATKYCHASVLFVHDGQTITAGTVIGLVGSTGNSTGPHLHFEVHRHTPPVDDSTAVDPVAFLASVGVRV